jgi:hypothetical protein
MKVIGSFKLKLYWKDGGKVHWQMDDVVCFQVSTTVNAYLRGSNL